MLSMKQPFTADVMFMVMTFVGHQLHARQCSVSCASSNIALKAVSHDKCHCAQFIKIYNFPNFLEINNIDFQGFGLKFWEPCLALTLPTTWLLNSSSSEDRQTRCPARERLEYIQRKGMFTYICTGKTQSLVIFIDNIDAREALRLAMESQNWKRNQRLLLPEQSTRI